MLMNQQAQERTRKLYNPRNLEPITLNPQTLVLETDTTGIPKVWGLALHSTMIA